MPGDRRVHGAHLDLVLDVLELRSLTLELELAGAQVGLGLRDVRPTLAPHAVERQLGLLDVGLELRELALVRVLLEQIHVGARQLELDLPALRRELVSIELAAGQETPLEELLREVLGLGVEHVDLLVVQLVAQDAGVQLDDQVTDLDPRAFVDDVGDRRAALDLALEHGLLARLDRPGLGHADREPAPVDGAHRAVVDGELRGTHERPHDCGAERGDGQGEGSAQALPGLAAGFGQGKGGGGEENARRGPLGPIAAGC